MMTVQGRKMQSKSIFFVKNFDSSIADQIEIKYVFKGEISNRAIDRHPDEQQGGAAGLCKR